MDTTYIIYSKEHSDAVLEVSNFLRSCCGIACEIDQYYGGQNITNWEVWNEHKIRALAMCHGYVLLLCSPTMYQQLSQPSVSVIQMKDGHINSAGLNKLIKAQATTHCIIPVCLEELNIEIVPISLRDRPVYHLSFSTLMRIDLYTNVEAIWKLPELQSLRCLVYRLKGFPYFRKVFNFVSLQCSYLVTHSLGRKSRIVVMKVLCMYIYFSNFLITLDPACS